MDQAQIEKLRAAGFSDDEIRDYAASQTQTGTAPAQAQTQAETLPEVDVTKPSETLSNAQAAGVPTGARESSVFSDIAVAAPVMLGENVGKVALGGAGLGAAYAANQVRKGMQVRAGAAAAQAAAQQAQAQAMMEQARAAQQAAQGVQERFAARQAAQALRPVAPSPILDQFGRPMATAPQPVAPQPMPTAPAAPAAPQVSQPSILDRTSNMIRQLAANKVVTNLAKGGVGAAALFTSGNVGQNYNWPQTGPLKGYEINPMTQGPWKPEELAAYNANPEMFAQQVAQRRAQMQMPR